MRVLFDSNVWIAAAHSPQGFCRRLLSFSRRRCTMVLSGPLFEEIVEKLSKKLRWPVEKVAIADRILRRMNERQAVRQLEQQVCRDRDDDWVLATAETGRCEYLVTGDGDLLVLGEFKGVKIVKPAEFGTIIGLPRS